MRRWPLVTLISLIAVAAHAQPLAWRFDTAGEMQGWKADNFQGAEVKGGFLHGVTKFDPMLSSPELNLDAARYPIIEFRVRTSVTDGGEIFWHGPGEGFSEQRMSRHLLQAAPEPLVYRVNMGALPAWRGTVTGIRLDLIDAEGADVALDYVRFLEHMPGAAPNDSFEDDFDNDGKPDGWTAQAGDFGLSTDHATDGDRSAKVSTGAGGKSVLSTRAPLDLLGVYHIAADVAVDGQPRAVRLSLIYYDVFGHKLADQPLIIEAPVSAGPLHLQREFTAPSLAASADVVLTVTGPNVTAWWDNIMLTHVREDLDLSSAPLETWRASWIWAADTYNKDNAPAYLRKSFDLPMPVEQVTEARVQVTADDVYTLYLNGKPIAESQDTNGWRTPELVDLKPYLLPGRNVLAVEARDVASAEGFLLEGTIRAGERELELFSDGAWQAVGQAPEGWQQPTFDDAAWPAAKVIAAAGKDPWGDVPYAHLGARAPIKLVKVELPTTVQAGSTVRVSAVIDHLPKAAEKAPVRFAWMRDGQIVFGGVSQAAKVAQGWQLGPQTVRLSRFLPPGKYEVALGFPRTEYAAGKGILIGAVTVQAPPQPEPPVRAEIKRHNGLPTLFLNGRPNPFMHYLELTVSAARIGNMANNGLHLYELDAGNIGWLGPDKFDYSEWDRRVLQLLTYDPEAVIIPTYDLSGLAHAFWIEAHPDELCRDAKGSDRVGIYGSTGKIISLASVRWREDYALAVQRFTEHCLKAPWGGRVIGYQPCSGVSWEWQHWGSVGGFEPTDYSAPMQEAFRQWTRRQYDGDVRKLQQAWNMPEATFETAQIPTPEQRDAADHLAFRDPGKMGYVVDFYKFYQDVMVDGIEHVFRTIKQSQPKALVGTYYGYTVTMLSGARRAGDSGHYALSRLLNSDLCDFLMSPLDYAVRGVGESYTVMSPIGSVLAHGKLWVLQADLRTHLVTDASQRAHGSPDSLAGTVSQLERAFANATAKGSATQWYDFSNGWIARDPRQGQIIGKLREIGQQWADWPQRDPDPNGVAVIVDEDSAAAYLGHGFEINLWLAYQQKIAFERLGAPWNIYLLDDVVSGRLPKFRCYFFLNCFHMSDAERQWITQNLQRDGRTLAWMYAPGYVTDSALSLSAMSELTGMQFTEKAETLDWRMTLSQQHPLTKGIGTFQQPNMKLGPVFVPQAEPSETAAVWEGTELPALVIRKQPQWTSLYSAGPLLSPELLKRIAAAAGVPVIAQSAEPSFVSRNMIGLHSAVPRTELLRFPQSVTVTDLMTGEVLGRKVKELAVPMQGPQTRLLRIH